MPCLTEGELQFTFPDDAAPIRFDGPDHGLSHCMKAVDFVVEFPEFYLFVEVKDPDDTRTKPKDRKRFAGDLTGPGFRKALVQKYRDSFLYRWSEDRTDKPIRFVVLLQLSSLQPPHYMALRDAVARELPAGSGPPIWTRALCSGLAVLNMKMWNGLGVYGTVRRG